MFSETIIAQVSSGSKFVDSDVTPELAREAGTFIKAYTGNFAFLLSVQGQVLSTRKWSSKGQVRGVLNCMVAQCKRESAAQQPGNAPAQLASGYATDAHNGLFTVLMEDEERRTIRISSGHDDAKDMQFVAYLSGSDNESSYTTCGYIKNGRFQFSKRYANPGKALELAVMHIILGTAERRQAAGREYAMAFAMDSRPCYICGRTLTDPISIATGVGPTCRANNGIEAIMPPDFDSSAIEESTISEEPVQAATSAAAAVKKPRAPRRSGKMLQATALAGTHSVAAPVVRSASSDYASFRADLLS